MRGRISVYNQKTNRTLFTDCNNLYGYCMQMKLPHREFQWMSTKQLDELDVLSFDDAGDYSAVLEVNM